MFWVISLDSFQTSLKLSFLTEISDGFRKEELNDFYLEYDQVEILPFYS